MSEALQIQNDSARMVSMIERMATDPACDPAKLRELLAVKQSWEADEARKAFAAAMASFQSRCPIISKLDTANGRAYARIDRIHREIRPLLKECGLWFSWTVCEEREGGLIYLEGIVGHASGHQVPCKQLISLPDKINGTNAAQRAGSGQTYAKRYGELAVLNIVTGDDDDGNGGKPAPATSALHGNAAPTKPDIENKRKLVNLTRSIHFCKGDKLDENGIKALTQYLIDEAIIADNETLADLSGQKLADAVAKIEKKLNGK